MSIVEWRRRGPPVVADRPRSSRPDARQLRPTAAGPDEPSTQPLPACLYAMAAVPSAGKGPGKGARMPFVDPLLIAFLAIVVVVSGTRRSWPRPGPGFRKTLPEYVPVPRESAYPQTPDAEPPGMPEWGCECDSHDSVEDVIAPALTADVRSNAFVGSWFCPSLSDCLRTSRWARLGLQLSEHPARRRATSAQRVHSRARQVAGASPRMSDHGAIRPNPRGSSTCQQ
jgi:hypothetical protein